MKLIFERKWILVILPAFYLLLSIIYLTGIKPFYIYNFDPAYGYLLNAASIAGGHFRVGNLAHPGTPEDCFAAIIIFTGHLFAGEGILYQDVLLHPESYLFTCSIILSALLFLLTYLTGKYVFKHTASIGLALLFQLSPLFFSDIVKRTGSLSAESGIVLCGIFFTAYLYVNAIGNKVTTNKSVVLFGLFTALIVASKIYCAPIILLVIFMIKKVKQKLLYLAAAGLFSLVFLSPVYGQIRLWAGTVKGMLLHSGAYGQGTNGIIDTTLYNDSIHDIFTKHHVFDLLILFVLAAFLTGLWQIIRKKQDAGIYFFPITGILVYFFAFILIIAKQYIYKYPAPLTHQVIIITKFYYFIPLFVCFPLAIIVSYKILSPLVSLEFFRLHKQKLFYILFIIFIAWKGQQAYVSCENLPFKNVLSNKTMLFLNGRKNTPLIIATDGLKQTPEIAYFLGVSFTDKWDASTDFDFIKKVYPGSYLYTTYNDELCFWNQKTDISTVMAKDNKALIYLNGSDSVAEASILTRICDGKLQKNRNNCVKVYSSPNKYEEIYLLKADTLY